MKIAVGIIAIMLSLLVMLQSCTIGTASHVLGDQTTSEAGAMGLFAGLLLFFGGAFAFGLPVVSACLFTLAGLMALLGAAEFPDLTIWAIIAFVLAGLSFFAWRSGKKRAASLGSKASA
ncbi:MULTISPECIES: hypothetical protein [unclassified Shinella]|uniref:hypothetical protein n=1 Tax=unclassified Shinella TaxID=2643062 RepID=UPI00234F26F0|nr:MULTISPECIES: hypothetical protein [unclassified Shinella]MCO5153926.1 hypothetical protein [Shinella sp.]MDC7262851.1 hypothetical protein [Shinella sp. HY16]MDC7269746.1 hypothetical protein [Shinella sp. YZ44]